MIDQLGVNIVVQGSFADYPSDTPDPYSVPKQMGILRTFESVHTDITSDSIMDRILRNLTTFENRKKSRVATPK